MYITIIIGAGFYYTDTLSISVLLILTITRYTKYNVLLMFCNKNIPGVFMNEYIEHNRQLYIKKSPPLPTT